MRIGAYKQGTDRDIDRALQFRPAMRDYLVQRAREPETMTRARSRLLQLVASIEAAGLVAAS